MLWRWRLRFQKLHKERLKKLYEKVEKIQASCAVVTSPADIFYLTGSGGGGLLVAGFGRTVLFAPSVSYYEASLSSSGVVDECIEYRKALPLKKIKEAAAAGKAVCDPAFISMSMYDKLRSAGIALVKSERLVLSLRMKKDGEEIKKIDRACRSAANVVDSLDVEKFIGSSEASLAAHLCERAWHAGCAGVSFEPVVAAGKSSASPHHHPSHSRIIEDGLLKIDYGVKYKGYASDLTRTFILNKFKDNFDYEIILSQVESAKTEAAEKLKPGAACCEIYRAAYRKLEEYGIEKNFVHGLGHGVGIQVHEPPYLKPGSDTVLQEGMVVTVEPGVYFPGAGGVRLEDTYLITREGSRLLTR